jgi:hypothetical protein
VKYPEGFLVAPYKIGKDHWTEGFARMAADKDVTEKNDKTNEPFASRRHVSLE